MLKKVFYTILIVGALISMYKYMVYLEKKENRNRIEKVVQKTENYWEQYRKLPDSVIEIIDEKEFDESIFYEKLNTAHYQVYLTIGFDHVLIYDSKSEKFRYEIW